MTFLLSSQNVFEYLMEQGLCNQEEQALGKIEPKIAKNFNLLLSFPDERQLLIKQEPYNRNGKTAGEFVREWRIQEFLQQFSALSYLRSWMPEVVHFDLDNSIMVVDYLDDHLNLGEFYAKENVFPPEIPTSIGAMLAAIHGITFEGQDYQEFLLSKSQGASLDEAPNLLQSMERVGPEVFGKVPPDGLKFLGLYQRYDSLRSAIAELSNAYDPCCLAHNDFKLNNILLPNDWQQVALDIKPSERNIVGLKLIDWERSGWGDPAFDLGMLISSYLLIWLGSLVVGKSIEIKEALRMAITPLEIIQPSLAALISTYLACFPQILDHRPDFVRRVVQFSGVALIQAIQSTLQYQKSFNNTGICTLQVAKTLLCYPEKSIPTVFGIPESALTRLSQTKVGSQ